MSIERTCEICGQQFYVPPSVVKKGHGLYCSWQCQHQSLKGRQKYQNDADNPLKGLCVCEVCGSQFYHWKNYISEGEGRFCSRECMGVWRSENCIGESGANWRGGCTIEVPCQQCGEPLTTTKSKRKTGRGKFCSTECYNRYFSENYCGENSHRWRGGPQVYPKGWNHRYKEQIRQRDGRECAMCGRTALETGRALDVHHIDYDKGNLDPSNLLALCRFCHPRTASNRSFWQNKLAESMATLEIA